LGHEDDGGGGGEDGDNDCPGEKATAGVQSLPRQPLLREIPRANRCSRRPSGSLAPRCAARRESVHRRDNGNDRARSDRTTAGSAAETARLHSRRPGSAPASCGGVCQRRCCPRQANARRGGPCRWRSLPGASSFRRMSMADQLLVSTRKGLFAFARQGRDWPIKRSAFLGQNVTLALAATRNPGGGGGGGRGGWFAALNLGHFGVKLHHSADEGGTW